MTRISPFLLPALLVPTLVFSLPDSMRAQSMPKTFSACYVSSTGTVYLIKEPGLRTDCANQNHMPFSWIDGVPGYDHGVLNGLGDDDHPQYLLADGTRALTGPLHAGGFKIVGLAAGTEAGDAVRFEQAVKGGDAAAGDLSGTYPNPGVAKLQGQPVSTTAPTTGQVLSFTGAAWTPVTPPAGITDHGLLNGLTDDDHPQYLLADGSRASSNGFAVTGTVGSGAIPATGAGARLMWYAAKAAFRAGAVFGGAAAGTQWDDVNIGVGSVALGDNTIASGLFSTAIGGGGTASGSSSVAMGSLTRATGENATAMGLLSRADGENSTALGNDSRAFGRNSTALGSKSVASGEASAALGDRATASGDRTIAMGTLASTNGQAGSFVYGDASTAASGGSTGDLAKPTAPNQFVVRASGGIRLFTNSSADGFTFEGAGNGTGCRLAASVGGGSELRCSHLIVAGEIEARSRFVFPDGTVQTTANAGGVTDHGTLTGLADDDHAQYVLANGVRAATNGFAVTGIVGNGVIPASGPGTRLMWYPGKAAFRAGSVDAGQWDDANVGQYSTAMGLLTTASGAVSTALGSHTTASGLDATALGSFTTASGDRSTAIGLSTVASGAASTALGRSTTASGDRSTAMGTFASTNNRPGSFVYGDESTFGSAALVQATAANQFVVRAAGGTIFYSSSDLTAGVSLAPGAGAWASVSDVNRKENFRGLDAEDLLARLAAIPVREWNYKAQSPSIRHLGPTAQDFHAAFGLGESDTTITTTDADGVALLAIQALERRTRDLERENARLRADLEALRAAVARQGKQP
jgi:hypothetical protein